MSNSFIIDVREMTEKRTYTKHRRAESEAETRAHIIEATVALHEEVGPARTTIAAIAERAGVHRPTVYRHFPTVEGLLGACSGHWVELHPPPDPASWAAVDDPDERLCRALDELFAYYEATEAMTRNVLRDAAVMPELEIYGDQFREYFAAVTEVLLAGRAADSLLEPALTLATAFETWQTMTQRADLERAGAVALAVALVNGVTRATDATTPIPRRRDVDGRHDSH